jgi:hypothetical protein
MIVDFVIKVAGYGFYLITSWWAIPIVIGVFVVGSIILRLLVGEVKSRDHDDPPKNGRSDPHAKP